MSEQTPGTTSGTSRKHTAGALDIRNIIGGLLGAYGVILLLMGIFDFGDSESERTGDVNANLWAGLIMIAVSAAFIIWARLRPIVVPDHLEPPDELSHPPGH